MGGYCTGARPKSLSYLLSRAVYIQTPHDKSCFIFPGGPRRSCHRSFGAYARLSRISAICLLAAASSQWRHIVHIRYKRWSEWCRLRRPNRFLPLRAGVIASDRTPRLLRVAIGSRVADQSGTGQIVLNFILMWRRYYSLGTSSRRAKRWKKSASCPRR
jgi:hypothetical protein